MKFPRILQIIVCLVLCVSIVFSLATPKAQAVSIVDDIGYIIWMILAAAGIVFPASNAAQIEGLGTSFTGFMDSEVGTEEEQSAWEEWCTAVGAILSSKDRPVDPRLAIPDVLMDLFALFAIKGAVDGYSYSVDLTEGFALYNDVELPVIPAYDSSVYPYALIKVTSSGLYSFSAFSYKPYISNDWVLVVNNTQNFSGTLSYFGTPEAVWGTTSYGTMPGAYCFKPSEYNIVWTNFDLLESGSVVFAASDPVYVGSEPVTYSSLVGNLADVTDPEEITTDDIVIPTTFNPSWLWDDTKTMDEVVFATAADLASGTLTHTDYLTMVQPSTEAGTEDDEEVVVGTLPVPTFWKGLTDVLSDVFVPDAAYLTSKVDALTSEFAFADSIISTGKMFGTELQDITTEPPVVYIDLPASTGSYDLGPRMPFVDLSWYAEYKPTGDALISAFLWAIFAWRMFQKLPAVISGMPGDFVMTTIDESGLSGRLPSRKKEYEETRRRNRRF